VHGWLLVSANSDKTERLWAAATNNKEEPGMSPRLGLFAGGKVGELNKRSLELEQTMGPRPTEAQLEQLRLVLEQLCEAGYWPAHKSLANLYGKLIWVALDWGETDFDEVSDVTKRGHITGYAALGLLQLRIFCERGGKKIDADTVANVESYQKEFLKYDPRHRQA
jgi:hypothetical protein